MVVLGQPGFDDYSTGNKKEKNKPNLPYGSFEEFVVQDPSKVIQPIPEQSKEQLGQNLFIGNTDNAFIPGGTIRNDVSGIKGNESLFVGATQEHPAAQDQMDYFNDYANTIIAPAVGAEPGTLSVTDPMKLAPEIEKFERMKTARPIPQELAESERISFDSEILAELDKTAEKWATYRNGEWIQDREDKYGSKVLYRQASTKSKVLHKLNKMTEYIESGKWQEDGITLGVNDLQDIVSTFQSLEVIGRNIPKEYEEAIGKFYRAITQETKAIDPGLTDKYYKSKPGLEYKSSIIASNMEERGVLSKAFEIAKGGWDKFEKTTSALDPLVGYMEKVRPEWALMVHDYKKDHNGEMPTFADMQIQGLKTVFKNRVSGDQMRAFARTVDPSGVFFTEAGFGEADEQGTIGEFMAKAIGTHDTSSNLDKWTNPAGLASGVINWIGAEGLADQTSIGSIAINVGLAGLGAPAKVAAMKASKSVGKKVVGNLMESVLPGAENIWVRGLGEVAVENAFMAAGGAIEQNQENLPDAFKHSGVKVPTQFAVAVGSALVLGRIGSNKNLTGAVDAIQKAGTTGNRTLPQLKYLEELDNAGRIKFASQTLEPGEAKSYFGAIDSIERNVAGTVRNTNINGTTIKDDWTKGKSSGEIFQDIKNVLTANKLIKSAKEINVEVDRSLIQKTDTQVKDFIKLQEDKFIRGPAGLPPEARGPGYKPPKSRNEQSLDTLNKRIKDYETKMWSNVQDGAIRPPSDAETKIYHALLDQQKILDHAVKTKSFTPDQKNMAAAEILRLRRTPPSFKDRARAYLHHSPLGMSVINVNNVDDFVKANMKIYKFDKLKNKKEIEQIVRSYGNRMEEAILRIAPEAGGDAIGLILKNVRSPRAWSKNFFEGVGDMYRQGDTHAFTSRQLTDPDSQLARELTQLDVHMKFITVNQTATKENLAEVLDTFFHEAAHTYQQILKSVMPKERYDRMMDLSNEWYLRSYWRLSEDEARVVLDAKNTGLGLDMIVGSHKYTAKQILQEAETEAFPNFISHVARNPEKYLETDSAFIREMESGLDFMRGLMDDLKLEGDSVVDGVDSLKRNIVRDVDEAIQPLQRDGYAGVLDFFGDPRSAHMTPVNRKFLNYTTTGSTHSAQEVAQILPKMVRSGRQDQDDIMASFLNEMNLNYIVPKNMIGKPFSVGAMNAEDAVLMAGNFPGALDIKVNALGRNFASALIKFAKGDKDFNIDLYDLTSDQSHLLSMVTKDLMEMPTIKSNSPEAWKTVQDLSSRQERIINAESVINNQLGIKRGDRLPQDPYITPELNKMFGGEGKMDVRVFFRNTGIDEIMKRTDEDSLAKLDPELARTYDELASKPIEPRGRPGQQEDPLRFMFSTLGKVREFITDMEYVATRQMNEFVDANGGISPDAVRGMIRNFLDKDQDLSLFRQNMLMGNDRIVDGKIPTFWDNSSTAKEMGFTEIDDMVTDRSVFGDQIFYHGSTGRHPVIYPEKMGHMGLHATGVYATDHYHQALMYMLGRLSRADVEQLPIKKDLFSFSPTGTMHAFRINVPESQHLNLDEQIYWGGKQAGEGIESSVATQNKFVDMWVDITYKQLENFKQKADESPLRQMFKDRGGNFEPSNGIAPTEFDYIRLLRSDGSPEKYHQLKHSQKEATVTDADLQATDEKNIWALLEVHSKLPEVIGDPHIRKNAWLGFYDKPDIRPVAENAFTDSLGAARRSLMDKLLGGNKTYRNLWENFGGQKGILFGQEGMGLDPKKTTSIATLMDHLDLFTSVYKEGMEFGQDMKRGSDVWDALRNKRDELTLETAEVYKGAERSYLGHPKKVDNFGDLSPVTKEYNQKVASVYRNVMRDTHNIRALSHMGMTGKHGKITPSRVPIIIANNVDELEEVLVRGNKSVFFVDEGLNKYKGPDEGLKPPDPGYERKAVRRPNIWGEDAYKNKWNEHGDIGKSFAEDAPKMHPPKENTKQFMNKVHSVDNIANRINNLPPKSPKQQVVSSMVRAGEDLVEVTFAGDKDLVPQAVADILAKPTSLDANGDLTDDAIKEIADEARGRMAGLIDEYRKIKNLTGGEIEAINRQNAAMWMKSPGPDVVPAMMAGQKRAGQKAVTSIPISKVEFKAMIEHSHKVFKRMSDSGKVEAYTAMRANLGLEKLFGMMASKKNFGKLKPAEMIEASELDAMEVIFGKQVVDVISKSQREGWDVFKHIVIDVLNFPRTVVASIDFSALFLQGFLLVGHPGSFVKSAGIGLKAALTNNNFRAIEQDMIKDPVFGYLQRRGLYFASDGLHQREETFISSFALKFPGISHSARAHITFLNKLRFDVAKKAYTNWKKNGLSDEELDLNMKHLCKFLNHASGRGDLGKFGGFDLNKATPVLNMAFFSPRLLVSRFQAPMDVLFAQGAGAKYARNLMIKDLAAATGLAVTIMQVMKAGGGDVEADPRSSNFGKGKFGPTRINFTGGYAPVISNMWKLMTGSTMTSSGDAMPLIGGRKNQIMRFFRSKMSPQAHIAYDLWRGKNFYGQDLDFGDQNVLEREGWERFIPLAVQEMREGFEQSWHDPSQGILSAFSLIGGATNTYWTKSDLSQEIYSRSPDQLHPWEKMMLTKAMELGGKYEPSVYDKRNSEIDYELFQTQKGLVRKFEASLKDVRAGKKTKKQLLTQISNEFYDLKDDAFQRKDENYKAEAKAMGWESEADGDEIKIQVGPGESPTLANAYLAYKYLGQQMREEDEGKYRVSDYENGFWERFDAIADGEGYTEDQMEYLYANININPLPAELLKHPDIAKKIKSLGRFEQSEKARAEIAKKHNIAYPPGTDLANVPKEYGFGEAGKPSSEERIKQLETRYPHLPEMGQ